MWKCRYRLPSGSWQNWAVFESFKEALECMEYHAQGRPFEIVEYSLFKLACGADPQELGIADDKGNWSMKKFEKHIDECEDCRGFTSAILECLKKEGER